MIILISLAVILTIFLILFIPLSTLPTDLLLNASVFLTFQQFLDFYTLCPNKWQLSDNSITFLERYRYGYAIGFKTLNDVIKYKKFYKKLTTQQKTTKLNEETLKFVKLMQKEIDSQKEQANKEVLTAANITQEVKKRLMKESLIDAYINAINHL